MTTHYAPGLSGIGTKERALNWVGKKFSAGWCLYFQLVNVFKVPGLGDYDHDGDADAVDYWKAAKKRGTVVQTSDPKSIPAGVLISWTGGSHGYGHAAYSLGNGRMVSTDLPRYGQVGECDIDMPRKVWGLKLEGYVLVDGNGFTLTRPEKATEWEVTTKAGLLGRVGPSTRSKVKDGDGPGGKLLRPQGYVVKAVRLVTGGGHVWAVTAKGTFYSTKYMKQLQ